MPKKKIPEPAVKDKVVRMRVDDAERAAMQGAARREGLLLSTWLRQLALRAAGVLR